MSSAEFTGPTAYQDALAHCVKASAAEKRESAAARRDAPPAETHQNYQISGGDALDNWHAMVGAKPASAPGAQKPAEAPKSFDSWQKAMDAGALDRPDYTPPASGPEEIEERFKRFRKQRRTKSEQADE